MQELHPIGSFGAEDGDNTAEEIGSQLLLDQGSRPIHAFVEIHWLGGDQNSHRPFDADHRADLTACRTALTVALSMPAGMRTTASPICTSMLGGCFSMGEGGTLSSTTGANTMSSSWK